MPLKYYYQFYHENKEKIHMKESDGVGQHPVNKEAVARWIERIRRLENEDERKFYLFFARAFASILETSYVSYTKFLSKVHAMAEEIYQKIVTEKYRNIVFVICGEIEKSNLWISLLCMDYWNTIRPSLFLPTWPGNGYADKIHVLSLMGDERDINFDFLELQNKKTLFLHFDDMSYSGGQAASAIHKLWKQVSSSSAPAAAGASPTVSLRDENVHYYLAMPYITEIARAYISEYNSGVKFLDATVRVPNFVEQVQTFYTTLSESEKEENRVYLERIKDMCHKYWFLRVSNQPKYKVRSEVMPMNKVRPMKNKELGYYGTYSPPEEFSKGVWAFRCSTFKTLIYFDHKLADDASTFQKVLYFGSYPINTKEENSPLCEHESLIQNCSVSPVLLENMKENDKNACRNYIQALGAKRWDINQRYTCPMTFYKGIKYTYGIRTLFVKNEYGNYVRNEKGTQQVKSIPYSCEKQKTLWANLFTYYTEVFVESVYIKYGYPYKGEKKIKNMIQETLLALSKEQEEIIARPRPTSKSNWVNIGNAIGNNAFKGGRNTRGQQRKKRKSTTRKKSTIR